MTRVSEPQIADLTVAPSPLHPSTARRLRIAMLGLKGLPATYGGVERHVEEIGSRLAARGHEVTVYCRTSYADFAGGEYRGMLLRRLPTISTKHLDAIAHSAFATVDAMAHHHDVIHYHALGPGLLSPLARCAPRAHVVLTVHGLDNERAKWGAAAKTVLNTAHWMSGHVPDATVVVSRQLAEHYREHFNRDVALIPNGVAVRPRIPAQTITDKYGLRAGEYALFVGRLVPEKRPDLLIRAWRLVSGPWRLVIAGGSSFTDSYQAELKQLAADDERVMFVDYVYGDTLAELFSNAAAFVLPSALEGMPLTLLEAASYGAPVVTSDIPPHVEIVGTDGPGHHIVRVDDEEALAATLQRMLLAPRFERQGAVQLRQRVVQQYTWDAAVDALESVYLRLCQAPAIPRQRTPAGA